MDSLPLDLVMQLVKKLPIEDVFNLAKTSKNLFDAIKIDEIWRALCRRDYEKFIGDLSATTDWIWAYQKFHQSNLKWLDPQAKLTLGTTINFNTHNYAMAYDADSRIVYVGGSNRIVKSFYMNDNFRFDPLTSYNLAPNNEGDRSVSALAINDQLLAVGTTSGDVYIFNKNDRIPIQKIAKPTSKSISFTQMDNEKIVYTSTDGYLKVWSLETNQIISEYKDALNNPSINCAYYENEYNLCVYGNDNGQIVGLDTRTWSQIGLIQAARNIPIDKVKFDQGMKIVCGTRRDADRNSACVKGFDWSTQRKLFVNEVTGWGDSSISAIHMDDNKILYGGTAQITCMDAKTFKIVRKNTVAKVLGLYVQHDHVVLGHDSNSIGVWRLI